MVANGSMSGMFLVFFKLLFVMVFLSFSLCFTGFVLNWGLESRMLIAVCVQSFGSYMLLCLKDVRVVASGPSPVLCVKSIDRISRNL